MRKSLSISLTTLCAATFIIGAVPSEASPTDPIVPKVCGELPVRILRSGDALAGATAALTTTTKDLDNKRNVLLAAVDNWVTAFANHLVELDKPNGNVIATKALLDAAQAEAAQKAVPWGEAKLAQWQSQHNVDLATIVHGMNMTLQTNLPCAEASG